MLASADISGQVLMSHNNQSGTSVVSNETVLTPTSILTGSGIIRLGEYSVDDYVFGQPVAYNNRVYVETMNNSLYSFDATAPGSAFVWESNFGSPNSSYQSFGTTNQFYQRPLGCLSTPVIDTVNSVLYIVCSSAAQTWTLRKINLSDGSTAASVIIIGQVVGTGDPGGGDTTSGANLLFFAAKELQRPGLKLSGGNIYVTFGGVGDQRPYHGWIMSYNSSLVQQGIWCSTPNGWGGAIWGGEPTFDGSGNAYVTTGNGTTYDGITNYTNSVVKLNAALAVIGDWFEPSNNVTINADDADTSSSRFLLLPSTSPQLGVIAAKDFNVYLIDTTCMGHLQGSSGCTLQTFQTNSMGTITAFSGSYGAAFMNGVLYLPTTAGSTYAFTLSGQSFNTTPAATDLSSSGTFGPAGMSGSCNGSSTCILWETTSAATTFESTSNGTLHAHNPATLAEYWHSTETWLLSKFVAPTVYNGKVFLPTQSGTVEVYGVLPTATASGLVSVSGNATIQ